MKEYYTLFMHRLNQQEEEQIYNKPFHWIPESFKIKNVYNILYENIRSKKIPYFHTLVEALSFYESIIDNTITEYNKESF